MEEPIRLLLWFVVLVVAIVVLFRLLGVAL